MEPLALEIFKQDGRKPEDLAKEYVAVDKGVETLEDALAGAMNTSIVEYYKDLMELYEMYIDADEAEMTAYLNDEDLSELTAEELALYEEYTKAMETDRNKGMLEVAKQYLESDEVVFYAVGLAHLLAEDGLVNTLRDAGYTVELVTE